MIYLSQNDPRWSYKLLGSGPLTVGRYGCTTTCISMLSDYFGKYMRPDEIAKNKDWYTDRNHPQGPSLIMWERLQIPGMKFEKRIRDRRIDAAIMESLKDPNKAVMLQVNNGAHWIVALRKTLIGNDYVCLDPWNGQKCDAIKKYHNITGSAHFVRN